MMKPNGRFRDAFIISEFARKISINPEKRTFFYYTGLFIRVNYSIKFGISSERFGELITKFSIYTKSIQNKNDFLINCLQNAKKELDQVNQYNSIFDFKKKGIIIIKFENITVKWVGSKILREFSEIMGDQKTNKIKSYAAAFSKTKKNPIDWRQPFPKPDFEQFIFGDRVVEMGQGYWIPKIKQDSLEDVGIAYFLF